MSQAKLGHKHSEETMLKISTSRKNNPVGTTILLNNLKTGETLHYNTISHAANAIDVSRITIKNYLVSGKLLKNTYYVLGKEEKKEVSPLDYKIMVKPSIKSGYFSIIVENIKTGEIKEYSSINAASKELGIYGSKLKKYMLSGECLEDTYYIRVNK